MNKALLLIGGLGLGAGLAHLLDPERRQHYLSDAQSSLRGYRRQADRALHRTQRSLGHTSRRLGGQARDLLAQASPQTLYAYWRRQETPQPMASEGLPHVLWMLGLLGLGGGLMYLWDPSAGQERRALIRQKALSYWHANGTGCKPTARKALPRAQSREANTP